MGPFPTLNPTPTADRCAECALPISPGILGHCGDEPGWSHTPPTMYIALWAASTVFEWLHSLVRNQLLSSCVDTLTCHITLKMLIACFLICPDFSMGLTAQLKLPAQASLHSQAGHNSSSELCMAKEHFHSIDHIAVTTPSCLIAWH